MIHGSEPSALFLDTIHAAYHLKADAGGLWNPRPDVTVSDIWNEIVSMGLKKVRPFGEVFAWDVHRDDGQQRNRIADIASAIKKGYVPGMRLAWNAKGREIVTHREEV